MSSNGTFFILNELAVVVDKEIATAFAGTFSTPGPWRPPEWNEPALTSITVPGAPASASQETNDSLFALPGAAGPPVVLVFDAVLRANHNRKLTRTRHPIQTSVSTPVSSISDHAYQDPATVTLEIGMSDAMASYASGMWTGASSKSISAYQTLVTLLEQRTLVALTTRLDTYTNMLVEQVTPSDDVKTLHGLRATVVFSKIYLSDGTSAQSTFRPVSDRPALTDSTSAGNVQPLPPSAALTNQHNVTSTSYGSQPAASTVPGAGNWSSGNVGQLGLLNA